MENLKFVISDYNKINDKTIDESIFEEEKSDFKIIDREDKIYHLIEWIGESDNNNDKELMKEDLKYIITLNDKYILSSIMTNEYIIEDSEEGQIILKEIYNL